MASSYNGKNDRKCSICEIHEADSLLQKTNGKRALKDPDIVKKIEKCIDAKIDEAKIPFLIVCDRCQKDVNSAYDFWQKCDKSTAIYHPDDYNFEPYMEEEELTTNNASIYKDAGTQTELLQSMTIIVNQIPKHVRKSEVEDIFSRYGKIQYIYFRDNFIITDSFARITFATEDDTMRVWNAAQRRELKLNDKPLMITLMSEDEALINNLPDDCLRLIFLHIESKKEKMNLEKVCKRWKEVSSHSWKTFTEYSDSNGGFRLYDTLGRLQTVLRRCGKFLKSLELHVFDNPKSRLELVMQYCDNLEMIELWFNNPEDSDLRSGEYHQYVGQILQHSTKLRRLFIAHVDNEFDFNHINNLSEDMLEIHLYGLGRNYEATTLNLNLSKFQNLKSLILRNFHVNMNSLSGLETLNNLEYLCFMGSQVHTMNLMKIQNFTKLKHLNIANCQINNYILSQIVQHNLDLTYLNISDIKPITDQPFEYIARLPKLAQLQMKNLTELTGTYLSEMHSLKVLNCNGCLSLKDLPLMMMVDTCHQLRELYAVDVATLRFLLYAEETLKERQPPPSDDMLAIYVHPDLQEKWQNCSNSGDNGVLDVGEDGDSDDSSDEADPIEWEGWFTTKKEEEMSSENIVTNTIMETD